MRKSLKTTADEAVSEGKCWEMWHPQVTSGPYCQLHLNHEGDHFGFGLSWARSPQVIQQDAQIFLHAYQKIRNRPQAITLRDDGMVEITLRAFQAIALTIDTRPVVDF